MFTVDLVWESLTHVCFEIFEDGQTCGQVVVLIQHRETFEALFQEVQDA